MLDAQWTVVAVDELALLSEPAPIEEVNVLQVSDNSPPPAPEPITPDDGVAVSAGEIEFEFSNVQDPDGDDVTYSVEVYLESEPDTAVAGFTAIEPADGASTTTRVSLDEPGDYGWTVWATDARGLDGAAGSPAYFSIVGGEFPDLGPDLGGDVEPDMGPDETDSDEDPIIADGGVVDVALETPVEEPAEGCGCATTDPIDLNLVWPLLLLTVLSCRRRARIRWGSHPNH